MNNSGLRGRTGLIIITLALALAAGCGTSPDDGSGEAGDMTEAIQIEVGSGPVTETAPLEVAIAEGLFAEEGLDVTATSAQSGAATISALIGGSLQFAASNLISILVAKSQGFDLQIVAQGTAGYDNGSTRTNAVLVQDDSDIQGPADLMGKTISVNSTNSAATLTINAALANAGVDYRSVEYVELPFSSALDALKGGDIDAAFILEPFLTLGMRDGLRPVLHPYEDTHASFAGGVIVATGEYVEEHPEVVERFQRAFEAAKQFCRDNPDSVREILPTYMSIEPELAQEIALPQFPSGINLESIATQIELADEYGYLNDSVTLEDLIAPES